MPAPATFFQAAPSPFPRHTLAGLLACTRTPPRRTSTSAGSTHSVAPASAAAAGWRWRAPSAPQAGPGRPLPGLGSCFCRRGSWPVRRSLGVRQAVLGVSLARLHGPLCCSLSCRGQWKDSGRRSWQRRREAPHWGTSQGESRCSIQAASVTERSREKPGDCSRQVHGGDRTYWPPANLAARGGVAEHSPPALWNARTPGPLPYPMVPKEAVIWPRVSGRR